MHRQATQAFFAFVLLLLTCPHTLAADRNKRQIIFEEDDVRRPDTDCQTPAGEAGRCVPLPLCPALRRIQRWNRLRRFVCGFEGSVPLVCCSAPEERGGGRPVAITTRRTTTTTTTRRPTTTTRRATTTTTRRATTTTTTRRTTTTTTTTTRRPQPPSNLTRPSFLPESCGTITSTMTRIVGGREATPHTWPWMAVVYVRRNGRRSPDCGGALVTRRHVVTAAHCVVSGRNSNTMNPRDLEVRLGAHDLRDTTEATAVDVGVSSVRRHERFEARTYRNDVAVLRLERDAPLSPAIQPVCLPYPMRGDALAERTAFAVGWGTLWFNGPASDVLMEASFDIWSQEECREAYRREVNITRVYLCAGTTDGSKDSCQGDSGGPLVTVGPDGGRMYLVGVVSFGKTCGEPGYPGVYARVTEFLDWLTTNLGD